MREQTGFGSQIQRPARSPAHSTGHYAGLYPEDTPRQTSDYRTGRSLVRRESLSDAWEEPPPSRSSARRYDTYAVQQATPNSIIRVTEHRGQPPIRRASRMGQSSTRDPYASVSPSPPSRQKKGTWLAGRHMLFYIGGVMILLLGGWFLMTALLSWVGVASDQMHYGYPRTSQTDKDVGHGGVSHFTAENLHGRILVTEIPLSDPSKAKIYMVATLSGDQADLAPATLSFEGNGNNLPTMVVAVENSEYLFIDTTDGFKPQNQQGGGA